MKIGNLYNLGSFKPHTDAFSDAAFSGGVLARQLTMVDPKVFEKKYPELTFVNSGVQVSNIGGYANVIQSLRLIEEGGFTNSNDRSGNKGIISLHAEDTTIKVMEREAQAKWTDTNVKQAEMEGYSLVSRYVQTKNKIYLRSRRDWPDWW